MPISAGLSFEIIGARFLTKPRDKVNFPSGCDSFINRNYYEIEFPSNIKLRHIPENVAYADNSIRYTATYILKENKLEVSRELIQQYPTMVCGETENEMDKKFFPIFQRDMRAQVVYE